MMTDVTVWLVLGCSLDGKQTKAEDWVALRHPPLLLLLFIPPPPSQSRPSTYRQSHQTSSPSSSPSVPSLLSSLLFLLLFLSILRSTACFRLGPAMLLLFWPSLTGYLSFFGVGFLYEVGVQTYDEMSQQTVSSNIG